MIIKYQLLQLFIPITLIFSKVSSTNDWIVKQPHLIKTGFTNILWEYIDSNDFKVNQNVTKKCKLSLNYVNQSMIEGQDWPIRLFEASGSIPDDFSGYGYLAFGNIDQCKQLNWINYDGNNQLASYCLTSFLPNNKTINLSENIFTSSKLISCEYGACFKIGFCLPSDCSSNDLQIIAYNALKPYDWDLFSVDHCLVNETFVDKLIKASILQKLCLFLSIVMILTVLVANILEYKSSKLNNNNNNETDNYDQSNWFHHLSFKSSYRQIVQPNWSSNRIMTLLKLSTIVHCINLSYHIFGWVTINKTTALIISAIAMPVPKGIVSNFLAPMLSSDWYVEGLFVYGGFARSMELWKKVGPTTRFSQLIVSTLTKLFSLSLLLLFILMIHINLPLVFSSGPYNLLQRESNLCLNNFWKTILLQNNQVYDKDNLCLGHFWSVSAESQLLLVIVVLVFLYKRYPKIGLTVNLITIIGSLYYVGFLFYHNKYQPHMHMREANSEAYKSAELYIFHAYLRTMSHLWMYSSTTLFTYLIMNDYVPTINKIPICKKINENLVAFGFSLFFIQPIYYNLIEPYQNQLILAIYVVVFRVICLIFWFFALSRVKISQESSEKNGFLKQNESTNLQEINQKKSIDLEKEDKQLKFFSIIATILKSTYCIHITVMTVILNSLRHQIVTYTSMFSLFIFELLSFIIGGLLFHFFILGPFTSIFVSMKKEKKTKSN